MFRTLAAQSWTLAAQSCPQESTPAREGSTEPMQLGNTQVHSSCAWSSFFLSHSGFLSTWELHWPPSCWRALAAHDCMYYPTPCYCCVVCCGLYHLVTFTTGLFHTEELTLYIILSLYNSLNPVTLPSQPSFNGPPSELNQAPNLTTKLEIRKSTMTSKMSSAKNRLFNFALNSPETAWLKCYPMQYPPNF